MSKENLKDKLDGNELDLSLSNLDVVPVKEIAAIPKATHLDLSCNLLIKLPPEFPFKLRHLTKLDISKNKLKELPEQFGSLQNLQTLDIFSNQLQLLPLSFGDLKSLKWLDLKDNPLQEPFSSYAGDCLDDFQCRTCARNMVLYMKKVQADCEKDRLKKLRKEQEKEAVKKQEEALERQKVREQKKAEKEEKRKVYMAQQAAKKPQEKPKEAKEVEDTVKENGDFKKKSKKAKKPKAQKGGISCCGLILALLLAVLAVSVGVIFYCDSNQSVSTCKPINNAVQPHLVQSKITVKKYFALAGDTMYSCLNSTEVLVRNSLKQIQEYYEAYVKNKDKVPE